jgi:hypothetical protein
MLIPILRYWQNKVLSAGHRRPAFDFTFIPQHDDVLLSTISNR